MPSSHINVASSDKVVVVTVINRRIIKPHRIPRASPLINKIMTISGLNIPTEITISDIRSVTKNDVTNEVVNCRGVKRRQIRLVVLIRGNNQIIGTSGIDNRKIIIVPLIATQNYAVIYVESDSLSVGNAYSQAKCQQ